MKLKELVDDEVSVAMVVYQVMRKVKGEETEEMMKISPKKRLKKE